MPPVVDSPGAPPTTLDDEILAPRGRGAEPC